MFGILGFRSVFTLKVKSIILFRRFQGCLLVWIIFWFLFVGTPVAVQYVSVPVSNQWPFSVAPGMPHRIIVDPEWPNGKPTVCKDVSDIKKRLIVSLNKKQKNPLLRKIFKKAYRELLSKVLPCKKVVRWFWAWGIASFCLQTYFMHVVGFFLMLVLHGGDGVMIVGDLSDLDKPYVETTGLKVRLRDKVKEAFAEMDENGDGRLSLDELLGYIQRQSRMKGPVCSAVSLTS